MINVCVFGFCLFYVDCWDFWQIFFCICWLGYYGLGCVDVCFLNFCQNQGLCWYFLGVFYGYICDCVGGYFGYYCEYRMDQQCLWGWWGSLICGFCNCDVYKGFDFNCNKINGQCYCKEFYY